VGTVAKLAVLATLDDEYALARQRMQQKKARHVGQGVAYGVRDLGVGIYKGITGIVTQPIEGARKEGALGLVKGIGKGLVGVVLKPAIGTVDLVSQVADGIKNTTTLLDEQKVRIRPPRHFSSDGLLRVYNPEKAIGQELLQIAHHGKYRNQHYVHHMTISDDKVLVISETHVLLLKKTFTGGAWDAEWAIRRKDVVQFTVGETEVFLIEQKRQV